MANKVRMNLRNITIENRLIYAFFLIAFISILIVGLCTMQITYDGVMNKSTNYSVQLVDAIGDNLKNELSNYEALLNELIVNKTVQKGLYEYDHNTYVEKAQFKNQIDKVVIPKLSSYPYIRDIKIVNLKDEVVYQHGYLLNDESHVKTMTHVIEQMGGLVQCFIQTIYGEEYVILSRAIYSSYTQEKVGYIIMVLKEEALKKVYEHINFGEGSGIWLIDQNQNILSSQLEENIFLNEEIIKQIKDFQKDGRRYFTIHKHYEQVFVIPTLIKPYNIQLVATIPYTYLLKEVMLILRQIVVIMILCGLLCMMIAKMICKSIIEPLKKLKYYISASMEEKFRTNLDDESPDELGMLSRSYVQITKEMQEMITAIEKNEKERRELELNMLQAQINPHFLFNTLNSLRWIAMMSKADSVSEGILALSCLLKNTIIQKKEYITIEDELENVKNYILIQKLRYGDSFRLLMDVEKGLLSCQTLKFILQPIVENAILHGIKEDQSVLQILISIREVGGHIIFTVQDDGKGFDPSILDVSRAKDVKLSGIGVDNVRDRIRLHFGENYTPTIQSEIGKGTIVTLHIPKMEGK